MTSTRIGVSAVNVLTPNNLAQKIDFKLEALMPLVANRPVALPLRDSPAAKMVVTHDLMSKLTVAKTPTDATPSVALTFLGEPALQVRNGAELKGNMFGGIGRWIGRRLDTVCDVLGVRYTLDGVGSSANGNALSIGATGKMLGFRVPHTLDRIVPQFLTDGIRSQILGTSTLDEGPASLTDWQTGVGVMRAMGSMSKPEGGDYTLTAKFRLDEPTPMVMGDWAVDLPKGTFTLNLSGNAKVNADTGELTLESQGQASNADPYRNCLSWAHGGLLHYPAIFNKNTVSVRFTDPEAAQGGVEMTSSYAATLRSPDIDAQQTWLSIRKATSAEKEAATLQGGAQSTTTSCPWASMAPQIIEKAFSLLPQKEPAPQISIDAIRMTSGKVLAHSTETNRDYWQAGLALEGDLTIAPNPGSIPGHTVTAHTHIKAYDLQINAALNGNQTVGIQTKASPFGSPAFKADMATKLDLGTWAGITTVDLHNVDAKITSNVPGVPSNRITLGDPSSPDLKTRIAIALRPHEETSETCYRAARNALGGDMEIPALGTFQRHGWAIGASIQSDAQHMLDLGFKFPIPDGTLPGSLTINAKTQAMQAAILLSASHAPRVDTDTLIEVASQLRGAGKEEPWLRSAQLFE